MKILNFCWAALLLLSLPALANKEVNNGGDTCEERFRNIGEDFISWIDKGGAAGLKLPAGLTLEAYGRGMRASFASTKVSCQEGPVVVSGAEKTCRNFVGGAGIPEIVCNFKRFSETSPADQYLLVHHEHAGVAGFEQNDGSASNYEISNQLARYLVAQRELRLSLTPSAPAGPIDLQANFGKFFGKYKIESCETPVDPGWKNSLCEGLKEASLSVCEASTGELTLGIFFSDGGNPKREGIAGIGLAGSLVGPGEHCSTAPGVQYCERVSGITHLKLKEADGLVYLDWTNSPIDQPGSYPITAVSYVLRRIN